MISSKNLLTFAKDYFNCSDITYLELEDTERKKCEDNLHWETRILNGEYMTSLLNIQDQAISVFYLNSFR